MMLFMNLLSVISPNFGSGRISRFSGRRRRDIVYIPLFRTLGAVFRTALPAVLDTLGVENAAQHVVAHARKVADAASADQHDRVLLQVVAFAGDVGDHLALVRQTNLGDLAKGRVRLLRSRRIDAGADAALLRILLHRRDLRFGLLRFATLADQLVDRRHWNPSPKLLYCNAKCARLPGRPLSAPQALASTCSSVQLKKRPKGSVW